MEEKIVKDGTKIILFALDTKDTSVTGWSTMYKELDLDNLMRKDFEVVPATGHPDCVRENGFIVSVPDSL